MISLFGTSFWKLQAVEFALIVSIMILPTTLMGAAFPLAGRLFVQTSATVGKSVGTLYASNTVGNILGSFAGGFILIPLVGIENTLFAAVLINVAVGVLFFALEPDPFRDDQRADRRGGAGRRRGGHPAHPPLERRGDELRPLLRGAPAIEKHRALARRS